MSVISSVLLAVVALCGVAMADTPADCKEASFMEGSWEFTVGPVVDHAFNCSSLATVSPVHTISEVVLNPAGQLTSPVGPGTWTGIYNEGFEAFIGDQAFFAFAAWSVDPATQAVTSHCDVTQVGWARSVTTGSTRCYSAKQTGAKNPTVITPAGGDKAERHTYSAQMATEHVEALSKVAKTWTPAVHGAFVGMSAAELSKIAGSAPASATPASTGLLSEQKPAGALPPVRGAGIDITDAKDIPVNFSWMDVDGERYVPKTRNQAKCGSCYTFGATAMTMGRVRVASNNQDQRTASPQNLMDCSQYSQGCDGGFGYLMGKQMFDFGVLSEECVPYLGVDGVCLEASSSCNATAIEVSSYEYVGGFYGGNSVEAMKIDLMRYGPQAIAFMATPNFMTYSGGIYVPPTPAEIAADPVLAASSGFFEETNHAVTLVGFGHCDKTGLDFWLVQNSWSTSWGTTGCLHHNGDATQCTAEKGYFKIVAGVNALNVESMPVTLQVVV